MSSPSGWPERRCSWGELAFEGGLLLMLLISLGVLVTLLVDVAS